MNIIKFLFDKKYRAKQRRIKLLEIACKEADRLHKITKKKYYVIEMKDGYYHLTMDNVNNLKKKGVLPKKFDSVQLSNLSVYYTL